VLPQALDRLSLSRLQDIDHNNLEPAAVYQAAADCLRDYVQQQYQIPVRNMTSSELLRAVDGKLPVPLRQRLHELLLDADFVKFSFQRPERRDALRYMEMTGRWIQAVAREMTRKSRDQKDAA
jgi:hypothetical protein